MEMIRECKWCGDDTFITDAMYCCTYCKEAYEGFNHDEGPEELGPGDYDDDALANYLEGLGDENGLSEESDT